MQDSLNPELPPRSGLSGPQNAAGAECGARESRGSQNAAESRSTASSPAGPPETATDGPENVPQPRDGARDVETPANASDGRVALRARLDAAIRPVMLFGLQNAELFDEPGRERINEWADWVLDTVLAQLGSPGTCDASIRGIGDAPIGPCVLRHGHDGPVHQAADGTRWAPTPKGNPA